MKIVWIVKRLTDALIGIDIFQQFTTTSAIDTRLIFDSVNVIMYYRARTPSKTGGSVVNLFKAIYSYDWETSIDDL